MNAAYVWGAVALYVFLGLLVALAARRQLGAGINEFFLGSRAIGGLVAGLSYATTTYSAFMLVGLAGLAYSRGVGALGFELIYLCGLFLVVFFGPRFWLVGHRFNYLTHAELLADRYQNRWVGVTAALLALIFLVPYASIQLMGISLLLTGVSQGAIPLLAGMVVAVLLALFWSNVAGLRSIAWTDALQAVIMMASAVTAVFFLAHRGFGGFGRFAERMNLELPEMLAGAGAFDFQTFLGLTFPWLFFSLSNPQVTQRLFVPKSLHAFKLMIGSFLIFGFVYTLVSVIWGFGALLLVPDLDNPDQATPALLALPVIPTAVVIFIMLGILSAAISTIDSILLTLSSMIARDIYRKGAARQVVEERELLIGKVSMPILAAVFFVFAYWASGQTGMRFMLAPLSAAASAGLLMVVPSIIGAFFWRKGTAMGALTSMAAGAVCVLVLQLGDIRPLGVWPAIWGSGLAVFLYAGVSLLTSPPTEKADEFMAYLARELPKRGAF